jgi:hypothetical protein
MFITGIGNDTVRANCRSGGFIHFLPLVETVFARLTCTKVAAYRKEPGFPILEG